MRALSILFTHFASLSGYSLDGSFGLSKWPHLGWLLFFIYLRFVAGLRNILFLLLIVGRSHLRNILILVLFRYLVVFVVSNGLYFLFVVTWWHLSNLLLTFLLWNRLVISFDAHLYLLTILHFDRRDIIVWLFHGLIVIIVRAHRYLLVLEGCGISNRLIDIRGALSPMINR